ncbi:MAG: hypothetical protein RMJ56_03960 [Gemmataceae bacterium]|nr:hypothetical protein [Gemmata sp.]MDW8196744.1 hypothetical protein [Gemmataceae bacterium]
MTTEEVKQRIVNEILLRGYDDHYIDHNEEREIVQIAVELGVSVENTLAALQQVCDEYHYVLESHINRQIEQQIVAAAGDNGRIGPHDFEQIFSQIKKLLHGKKSDRDIKAMIIAVMERTGYNRIKNRWWFGNWYTRLKREVGLA